MIEEKGILDDIEDLVGDFQKKKTSLEKLSPLDFVDKFFKPNKKTFIRQVEHPENEDRWAFDEYHRQYLTKFNESKQEYNNKIKFYCECGTSYIVYTKQDLENNPLIADYTITEFQNQVYEKPFFCLKCGKMTYMRASSQFEIVSIKHEESLKI